MKRIGMYTGNIYDCAPSEIHECCFCVSDNCITDENFIKERREEGKLRCAQCPGYCKESKEA